MYEHAGEGPEGVKWFWDFPILSPGKWDLGHWDCEPQTKTWERN